VRRFAAAFVFLAWPKTTDINTRNKSGVKAPQSKEYPARRERDLECGAFPPLSFFACPKAGSVLAKLERAETGNVGQDAGNGPARLLLTPQKDWPHAPLHRLSEHGTFIVTASTLYKEHFFRGQDRLTLLEGKLLALANSGGQAITVE
jgi:hypothetical protein